MRHHLPNRSTRTPAHPCRMVLLGLLFALWHPTPAEALSTTCRATLSVVAPQEGAYWLPGKLVKNEGRFTLSFGLAQIGATAPATVIIEVDVAARLASYRASESATPKELSFDRLARIPFAEIASTPEALGGLVLVGDRLKAETRFLRNATYLGEPIQVYAFKEGEATVGQIYYSPSYGVPLKLDVFDTRRHIRHVVELTGLSR